MNESVKSALKRRFCQSAAFASAVYLPFVACASVEVVYENDFSSRSSKCAIPSGRWLEQKYAAGLMANTDGSDPLGVSGGGQNMQDGWIKDSASGANARVWKDSGNSMAVLGHASAAAIASGSVDGRCVLKQRIGNTFASGIVAVQFDMRPPTAWQDFGGESRRTFLCVGDEDFYSPDVEKSSTYSRMAAAAGVCMDAEAGQLVFYRDSAERTTAATVAAGNWLRIVMTIDIDRREWGFSAYDMGSTHPLFSDATPATPVFSQTGLPFADMSVNSVSSIALCGFGVCWNAEGDMDSAPGSAACFDGLRVAHNGDECYLNDFASCQRRSLVAGTTSANYVADSIVTNTVGQETYPCPASSGTQGEKLVPNKVGGGVAEPTGLDGWRRVFESSEYGANAIQLRNESGNCCVRFDNVSRTGVAHPIGTTVTSGSVRLKLDMRVPSSWGQSSAARMWITLGNDMLYNGIEGACRNGRYLHVGISYRSTTTDGRVRYLDASGNSQYADDDGNSECQVKMGTWYRAEIIANLDSHTYDYTLYEQGSATPEEDSPDGTKVFSVTGVGRMNGINEISTFAVWAFIANAFYDNIKIWHKPSGETEETLLYSNSFSTRTVCQPSRREGVLTGTTAKDPQGRDGWTAVGIGRMCSVVSDGSNPAMSFKNPGKNSSYAVHEIGQTLDKGVFMAQADIRPPRGWLGSNGAFYVRLGGDKHLLGSVNDQLSTLSGDSFVRMIAGGFGFNRTSGGSVAGVYTNVSLVAWQGNRAGGGVMTPAAIQVDTTHWYRFIASMDMSNSQYDLAVYDMGASHPAMSTPLPENPVATFSALPFRQAASTLGGVSCLSVNAQQTASSPLDDTLQPYVDNIRISRDRSGLMVIVH